MSDGLRVGQASPGVVDPAVWSVQSIGDLNGDGASDVLWRDTEGQLALWFSADPNTVVYPAYQNVPGAVMDTSWRVLGLADFNADGRADILWLSPQSVMNIWIMNGGQFVSEHFAGVLGLDWSLKGLLRQAIPLPTPWPFPGPVVIDAATP